MSSLPVNNFPDNPFFKFSLSPDDVNRRARTFSKVELFGSNSFGLFPRGLADASDTFGSPLPSGIVQKAQARRNVSPMAFVMPDTGKCPCCKRSDVEMYCSDCVNNVFFQPHNIRRKRSEHAKRKAKIGKALKEQLAEPARIQAEYYATKSRVDELRELLRQKRSSIAELLKDREKKTFTLKKLHQNLEVLKLKVARHKSTISQKHQAQQAYDLNDVFVRFKKVALKVYDDLSKIIKMEPVAFCEDDSDVNRIVEQIDDALSFDQNTLPRYNEVAKRNLVIQSYYLVNKCYVPSDGNYSQILSDIEHTNGATLAKNAQDTIRGLGYVAKFVIDLSKALNVFVSLKENVENLYQNTNWTRDEFETSVFALNLAVLTICLNVGVDAKQLCFKQLFNNLRLCQEVLKSGKRPKQPGRLDHKDVIFREINDNLTAIKFADDGTGSIECITGEEGWEHVERFDR